MTFGSLFAGIGGMDLGLERAGMECRWQVEIDPYCCKVLAKHWPDVPKYEDVRDVGEANLEPVDLICGGFPCQDISYAGKGAGLTGERSGLWYEFARIIGELGPRIVLVENVAALLTRGLGDVLGTLASLGYDAEWDGVPAAPFGAPYARDRIFVLGFQPHSLHDRAFRNGPRFGEATIASGDNGTLLRKGREEDSYARWERRSAGTRWDVSHEPGLCRVAHGVSSRMGQLRGYGNAVVPQVAEWIGKRIMKATVLTQNSQEGGMSERAKVEEAWTITEEDAERGAVAAGKVLQGRGNDSLADIAADMAFAQAIRDRLKERVQAAIDTSHP